MMPGSPTILVVDDDHRTTELVRLYLENEGYRVLLAHDGDTALALATRHAPDLLVLDLMLPGLDGLDVCRRLRTTADTPIIMLTARTTEEDRLRGLDLGADDYITKPFSPREVVARVRAVLRRVQPRTDGDGVIALGPLAVDFSSHQAHLNSEPLKLTPKEFALLGAFIRNPGHVFSRLALLEAAFGYDYDGLERTIDVHIMNLRRKLEPDPNRPRFIQTVYGVGYKLVVSEGPSGGA